MFNIFFPIFVEPATFVAKARHSNPTFRRRPSTKRYHTENIDNSKSRRDTGFRGTFTIFFITDYYNY